MYINGELEIGIPQKPHQKKTIRREKFKHAELFENLINYHPKIKLTIEVSPTKFFNANLNLNNGMYNFTCILVIENS